MLAILMFLVTFGMAQNIMVKGKVTEDETGATIPSANVVLKGTTTGVSTDVNGNFSISAPANGTLIFSFIGFNSIEVPVAREKGDQCENWLPNQ